MDEWQLARQDAINELKAEHAMQANFSNNSGADFTLTKSAGNQLFLISAKSPQQLRANYTMWVVAHLGALALLLALYITLS